MTEANVAAERLSALITAGWAAQAVYVMAELHLGDLLDGTPQTADELAEKTGAHPDALARLLRGLATLDLLRSHPEGKYELTAMGEMLAERSKNSMRSWALWCGAYNWPVWGNLLYTIRTGKSARAMLSGTEAFGLIESDPQAAVIFDRAMAELTHLSAGSIVRSYDFSPFKTIVDVGGGTGALLEAILRSNPGVEGVLFDRDHAIEGAKERFAEDGLKDRVKLVTGDFFASIHPGADAYLLKSVIHDWDDSDAAQILSNCLAAMNRQGTLLLVERVLPDAVEPTDDHRAAARADLHMLVALGARERTETQFRTLLETSGFRLRRTLAAGMGLSLLESAPA